MLLTLRIQKMSKILFVAMKNIIFKSLSDIFVRNSTYLLVCSYICMYTYTFFALEIYNMGLLEENVDFFLLFFLIQLKY